MHYSHSSAVSQDTLKSNWCLPKIMKKLHSLHLGEFYYYTVIASKFKNVGITYQRAMNALFHFMMHKKIEVFVDDII